MEQKQTAVQLLKERLPSLFTDDNNGFYFKLFEQALEMEREQIEDAYVECYMNHVGNGESILREANSYYKNTYGGKQ
jgi:hypothetical protein